MKRTCILILLLVVVFIQTGCPCWSNCPPDDVVQWHTPPYGTSGE
jgi:hypothetical protein